LNFILKPSQAKLSNASGLKAGAKQAYAQLYARAYLQPFYDMKILHKAATITKSKKRTKQNPIELF